MLKRELRSEDRLYLIQAQKTLSDLLRARVIPLLLYKFLSQCLRDHVKLTYHHREV